MRVNLRGFTVLEILAVVVILAVLVALSFPAYEKIRPAAELSLIHI
jgi:prepilin-type N-terminal cleavage/methylation domain-containing protein